ncbi:hypothetical protein ACJJTC_005466 [Scirpophaga incertulas]
MSLNYGKCSGCKNVIDSREFLECSICNMKYDINCANVSSDRFYSFYAQNTDQKRNWKCRECCSKQPKIGNSNTPAHSASQNQVKDAEDQKELHQKSDNVTFRSKRVGSNKKTISPGACSKETTDTSDDCKDYVTESKLRSIIKQELAGALNSTIKELVSTQLKDMAKQIKDMRESLAFFNSKYEDLKSALDERNVLIDNLNKDNTKLKSTVCDLSNRLNLVEQTMRESNLEINGIPENRQENVTNLMEQLMKTVDAPVSKEDILHVTRVAKLRKDNTTPRTVIVKLRTLRQRDAVLAAVAVYNKKNDKDKLNSRHLGLGGTSSPVFVAEHLSPANKALHAATRLKAKECKYKFVWVRNGRIFIRKDEFSQAVLIRSMENIASIK